MGSLGTSHRRSAPWLIGAIVALVATFGHVTGRVSLDGLNPLYLAGCASVRGQAKRVQRDVLPVGLESGLTLSRQGASGTMSTARFARGQIVEIREHNEPLVLVGVDTAARTVRFEDGRGAPVDVKFADLDHFHLSDGRNLGHWMRDGALVGAAGAGAPGLAFLLLVAPCTILMSGQADEMGKIFVATSVVPAAVGAVAGTGAGALYGAIQGSPVPYRVHPSEWQVAGGRGALLGSTPEPLPPLGGPSRRGAEAVGGLVPEPVALPVDDPICLDAQAFGLQLPPGCRCGDDNACASGLCADALGEMASERRCTSRCPLGCPDGKACLLHINGGAARCGAAP